MSPASAAAAVGGFTPATYDLVWTVVVVAGVALLAAAVVAWGRSTDRSIVSLVWFFVMLAFPIVGPIGYLVETRRRRRLQREEASADGGASSS
ncbi:PLDc N-terminal domain-containing protein [Serinibacter arcticus]|uniref:Cardiolipin synthase N-terminal domain-containing protein n=1 Tax=Serinibacter arcticus TaxID=1655435 RepID=A0A4Z1E014_9MICO|nr:PLDc N-terminal domain-containing protein [Serinibacter arcticus]TGO04670.1 hypothetical protein SERN_2263 [Serinibacter arcticus]